ncbi:MAG: hypothetical protein ACOYJ8_01565 [Patescibacteria group bacterium]|jgi:peptidoglycan hydrolase CwlO-like protein
MRKKIFWGLIVLGFLASLLWRPLTWAVSSDDLEKIQQEIKELEEKVAQTREQKQTLSSQIAQMNQQIQLATLRIAQTETSIVVLEEEIASLSEKIDKLDLSLDKISQVLLRRIVATYKGSQIDPAFYWLTTDSAEDFIRNQQYLKVAQKHDKMLMMAVEEAKQDFDRQKSLKEEKQAALEGLRVQLKEQNIALDLQKKEKERLLEVTKNNEVRYQQLLAQAQRELTSLLSFTRTRVGIAGSTCAGEFSSGNTGWFFSQRDSRWCNSLIGHSDMTIGQVGCLINSVAMVNKSKGVDITPLGIANNSSFFFLNTAYMLLPFPSFVDQNFVEISKASIDGELAKDNPVIVHLGLGGDGHWVVLVKKDGDDYIINDPWYGPDKKLTDYYSWGLVGRPYVLK